MNCQQVDRYILDYCNNILSPELAVELEQHAQECFICAKGLELTKIENSLLHSLPILEPSSDFTAKVMQNINIVNAANNNSLNNKANYPKSLLWLIPIAAVLVMFLTTSFPNIFNFNNTVQLSQEDSNPQIITESEQPLKISLNDSMNKTFNDGPVKEKVILNQNQAYLDNDNINIENEKIYELGSQDLTAYDREIMKQDSPNRAESMMRMANIDNASIELTPQNIPPEFSLLEVRHDSDEQLSYYYTDEENQIKLDIIIARISSVDEKANEEIDNVEQETQDVAGYNYSALNVLTFNFNNDDKEYLITIKSNLSEEKIISLSSSINFTN